MNNNDGYSLIELLVVIVLVGIIGTLITHIFILGLRSQSKSGIVTEVKQNGDYVFSVIETMVRNAVDIAESGCNLNSQQITIFNNDGFTSQFDCSGSTFASISAYIDPTPTVHQVLISEQLEVNSCNFRVVCPTPPLSPKYVFINFTLSEKGSDRPVEQKASIDYQATVSLRNY